MKLSQLKQPTKANKAVIKKAGLTVEDIATMTPYKLMKTTGIGRVKSEAIVKEARDLVNAELLKESKVRMPQQTIKREPIQKSVRIRRIEESQK